MRSKPRELRSTAARTGEALPAERGTARLRSPRLSPRAHGLLEYAAAPIWIAVPVVLDWHDLPRALAQGIGAGILGIAMLTDYPVGLVRVIPFPVHGWIDRIATPVVAAAPWLLGFESQPDARGLFLGMGVFAMLVTAFTDFSIPARSRRTHGPSAGPGPSSGSGAP